jgi:signal transduction histidine kinase
MRRIRWSIGILGQILAILLLTVLIEFGASTFLYERASRFSLHEDEARRLAEHLVIARKLVAERPPELRPGLANELTTERYHLHWARVLPPPPPLAPELDRTRHQIIAWEPSLERTDLRLRLTSPGRKSTISGGLRLSDGSWLYFSTREAVSRWDFVTGRALLALVPAIALFIIGGLLIRNALSPIRRLARATERVGVGVQLGLPEQGTSEVRGLIRAFNTMQERIHRLIAERTQALAAVGHDIRTPLARLQLRLDSVADDALQDAMGRDIAEMEAMVASLLAFLGGEQDPEAAGRVDLAILLRTLADDFSDRGHPTEYIGAESLEAMIRAMGMRRAVTNLLENAFHHGTHARVSLNAMAENIVIAVEDDGPGIAEDRLAEVLLPFARLDSARSRNTGGLGLGLAIVVQAVERERGRLHLSNRPQGGLRVEITLPA